jgi:hypothetical protein
VPVYALVKPALLSSCFEGRHDELVRFGPVAPKRKMSSSLSRVVGADSSAGEHTPAGYSDGDPTPKVPSVKVCPHCAEELSDEATVCSNCNKDPAAAPAWNAPERPDETSLRRLGDVFGLDGVLPTSDQVPAPFKHLEPSWTSGIPSKVWMSLILALVWGFASG